MDTVFLCSGVYLTLLMAISLYRAVFGPTVLDRMIGVNAIGSKTTVLLIIIGLSYHRVDMFVDIALAYAMLNFIAVLAASRYFQKRKGLYDEREHGCASSFFDVSDCAFDGRSSAEDIIDYHDLLPVADGSVIGTQRPSALALRVRPIDAEIYTKNL